MHVLWRISILALVGLLAAFALTGCCPWLGEQAAEEAIEQSTGGDVEIDDDGESVKIETDEGTMEIQGEGAAEVPAGFPSSMPIYDGDYTFSSAVETPEGQVYTLGIETGDGAGDVSEWYRGELSSNGWEILSDISSDSGDATMYAFTVESSDGQGQVTIAEQDGVTTVSLTVTSEGM